MQLMDRTLSQATQSKRQHRVGLDLSIKKIRGFTLFTVSHMGFLALHKHIHTHTHRALYS